jgi:hypothetical protein
VGFLTDAGLVPDPSELVKAFEDEVDAMYRNRRRPAAAAGVPRS